MINSNFLTHPEWDPAAAGKILALSEVLGKWMVAIKDYHYKRLSLTSLYEELSELKVNIFSFVRGMCFIHIFSCWQALETEITLSLKIKMNMRLSSPRMHLRRRYFLSFHIFNFISNVTCLEVKVGEKKS